MRRLIGREGETLRYIRRAIRLPFEQRLHFVSAVANKRERESVCVLARVNYR